MFASALFALLTVTLAGGGNWPSDLNDDGKVTLPELQTTCRIIVMKADSDGDGRISSREWAIAAKDMRRKEARLGLPDLPRSESDIFRRVDTDRDGYVTAGELDAAAARRFDRRDLNRDGVITFDEASRGDLYAVQP